MAGRAGPRLMLGNNSNFEAYERAVAFCWKNNIFTRECEHEIQSWCPYCQSSKAMLTTSLTRHINVIHAERKHYYNHITGQFQPTAPRYPRLPARTDQPRADIIDGPPASGFSGRSLRRSTSQNRQLNEK